MSRLTERAFKWKRLVRASVTEKLVKWKRLAEIELVEMTDEDYLAWRNKSVAGYAAETVKAGNYSSDVAEEESNKELEKLLPDGRHTKDHYLFTVVQSKSGLKVGMVWFATNLPNDAAGAAIYDIVIDPQFRGKGYGTAAMLLVEERVRGLGAKRISLQVFGHNAVARELYEKLGYVPINVVMSKELD